MKRPRGRRTKLTFLDCPPTFEASHPTTRGLPANRKAIKLHNEERKRRERGREERESGRESSDQQPATRFQKALPCSSNHNLLVTKEKRSIVTLSRESEEKGSSNDTGNHQGGENHRLNSELYCEVTCEEDDQNLHERRRKVISS